MLFRRSIVTLVLALAAFGTPLRRDEAKVVADIKQLSTQAQSLDNSVKAFPSSGGTLAEALVSLPQSCPRLVPCT